MSAKTKIRWVGNDVNAWVVMLEETKWGDGSHLTRADIDASEVLIVFARPGDSLEGKCAKAFDCRTGSRTALGEEVPAGPIHMWDFSDLTGDSEPIFLFSFFAAELEDLVAEQISDMLATPVGGTYTIDLGAGGVLTYRRVS